MTDSDRSTAPAARRYRWRTLRRVVQLACLAAFALVFVIPPLAGRNAPGIAGRFLVAMDPLVGAVPALAGRASTFALGVMAVVLVVALVLPRWFCGLACPMGTLIDLFDLTIGRLFRRLHILRRGWWLHMRYGVLAGVLATAAAGVLLIGYLAPLPLLARAMTSLGLWLRGTGGPEPAAVAAVAIVSGILLLGVLGRRFWCRALCPSGALFSLAALLRLRERRVGAGCLDCGKCRRVCHFGAVRPDWSTRPAECTSCRTCIDACPVGVISYGVRAKASPAGAGASDPVGSSVGQPPKPDFTRRSLLFGGLCGAVAVGAGDLLRLPLAVPAAGAAGPAIRPPGSLVEADFLRLCTRCGLCIDRCPTGILRPMGLGQGLDNLWTPRADADRAACRAACNACGVACPTGAIRALGLAEKRTTRMGLAVVNVKTCLPYRGTGDCGQCAVACSEAGYDAITLDIVGERHDAAGQPVPNTGKMAPVVDAARCVGCGACQVRCRQANVTAGLLERPAIVVRALPRG